MRIAQRVASMCLIAAAFSYTPVTFADNRSFLDEIYFNASALSGRAESSNLLGGGGSIGLSLPKNMFVQADYHYLDLTEGLNNTHLFKGIFGVQEAINNSVTVYFGGGGYYGQEDGDNDDSGEGVVLSTGMTLGSPKVSALLHVDYLNNTKTNSFETYLIGIGIRIQLGGNRVLVRKREENPSSLNQTTACKDRYGNLFPLCDTTPSDL
ncbi:MAG: hypothetical protein R3208_00700 [Ketobacteraceae bacterium]|nr:hypothetical protein [Ketobacteraceae bacterium]